jgi:late competence protein required for DNA uptake (superfamily II DNA/RNA helicase)
MKCNRCNREISEDESFAYFGEVLCDDCYMDVRLPVKSCDPWAVYSATRTRESSGLTGVEGLTSLQQAIYAFIKNRGKVTSEDIITKFSLSQRDMQNQFATLRHCELIKGRKEKDKVYIVPFEST